MSMDQIENHIKFSFAYSLESYPLISY